MLPFALAWQLRRSVLDYLRTTFAFCDEEFEAKLFAFLDGEEGLFRGPYVDVKLPFRKAEVGAELPMEVQPDFVPYAHQLRAFERLHSREGHAPQHTLVTTGTGSGKTECFLYPILDHCLAHVGEPGIKAILLYPMNALASDQARRIAQQLWEDPRLKGRVRAGLYVGGKGRHAQADALHLQDKREVLRENPPDILLTNYKMLDFLLLRPDDRELWRFNEADTLRYLVLDELHTYDGAQGSDVACLIRRLKARLGMGEDGLCCVGTSATVGEDGEGVEALLSFAGEVFEADMEVGAVVREDRYDVDEVLGPRPEDEIEVYPASADAKELEPSGFEEPSAWLRVQKRIWLGTGAEECDPVALGLQLKKHVLLRDLLHVLRRGLLSWQELDKRLGEVEPDWSGMGDESLRRLALQSFLSLISVARSLDGDGDKAREIPFLTVQVQFWVRELRQLLRKVDKEIGFRWASELGASVEGKWLPIARCRECGGDGLAAVQRQGEASLLPDWQEVGRAWLESSRNARYLTFRPLADGTFPDYLGPLDLSIDTSPDREGEGTGIGVQVEDRCSEGRPPRFLGACPDCDSRDSLSILGARAATLGSVLSGQTFLSEFEDAEPKMLAFTDSVQDATHRAGFFGARTFRFTIRAAIQDCLENADGDLPLEEAGDLVINHWLAKFGPEKRAECLTTLLPADLRDLESHELLIESAGRQGARELEGELRERMGWEVCREYGLASAFGRTLERTGCSTLAWDAEALDRAAGLLELEIQEENLLDSVMPDRAAVRHFLSGILHRLKERGGVYHPLLQSYVKEEGNRFLLSKKRNPLMSPFGPQSRLPRFVLDRAGGGARGPVFDVFGGEKRTWYRDWVGRAFEVDAKSQGIHELLRQAFLRLEEVGILCAFDTSRHHRAYGLDPSALRLTGDVMRLVLRPGTRPLFLAREEAERWIGRVLPLWQSEEIVQGMAEPEDDYYRQLYRRGRIRRIFSEEHTGLLSRNKREDLEDRFKEGRGPAAPNLIVATPTLEMGIDVGDLSTTMLCSVPPTTANYLQRIGRAGRNTGNALCMTLALTRPHDLYFHLSPEEMMQGQVLPPGCFLNAPEMLKRQWVAFAMDQWARQEEELRSIPRKTSLILSEAGGRKFPGRFLEHYAKHRGEMIETFLAFFPGLTEENRERMLEFASGERVAEVVQAAIKDVSEEIGELRGMIRRTRARQQDLKDRPEDYPDPEAEKVELEGTVRILSRLVMEINEKYPLNVLTDAGVLPNYAFPEPGVALRSVVRSRNPETQETEYRSFEYQRPASVALRELAPMNTFYAEGRRVRIDEIDVGSRSRSLLENWRVCAACAYMERHLPAPAEGSKGGEDSGAEGAARVVGCPRCGDETWDDAGQVRTMVNFRRARSLASALEATTVDDSDEREEVYYMTRDLISVGPENYSGARQISKLPFGYELLKGLRFREVNFGLQGGGMQGTLQVAGDRVSERGFEVCEECGRVLDSESRKKEILHAPSCPARKTGKKEKIRNTFLYRSVESEAIRVLLPVATLDLDVKKHSFRAALQLGFRRWFQGEPAHLVLRTFEEPRRDGGTLNFLLIFDAVPGGTGYLAELWQEEKFLAVLEKALEALLACRCRQEGPNGEEPKDGCYRCLFAFQEQRHMADLSSRCAQEMIEEILKAKDEMEEVDTLSGVEIEDLLESELEKKFVRMLEEYARLNEGVEFDQLLNEGQIHWRLRLSDRVWDVLPQVDLGPADGVALRTRPDFMIVSADRNPDVEQIAIYCDGLEYHVCPRKDEGRIGDDIQKRSAILEAKGYRIWNLTWQDLEEFGERLRDKVSPPSVRPLLSDVSGQKFVALIARKEVGLDTEILKQGAMDQLLAFLRQPDPEQWQGLVGAASVLWLVDEQRMMVAEKGEELMKRLADPAPEFDPGATLPGSMDQAVYYRSEKRPWFHCVLRVEKEALREPDLSRVEATVRLFDENPARDQKEFGLVWRQMLMTWNLLQFLGRHEVYSTSSLSGAPDREPVRAGGAGLEGLREPVPEVEDVAATHAALLEEATAEGRELLLHAMSRGLPLPEVGHELEEDGVLVGEADLAWPGLRVAVLGGAQLEDRQAYEARAWTVLAYPVTVEDLEKTLREREGTQEA